MRLLTDVCFFHLRNDTVAQSDKWLKPEKQHDHPIHMDWAKEGRVPMLKMTRSAFLEACERDHNLSELIVSDILRLEGEAQREGRAGCQEHEDEQWLRLQLLRFLHVEQEDTSPTQKVSFQVMQRLWHKLPSELCCKWFRVLADSGEALTEEQAYRADGTLDKNPKGMQLAGRVAKGAAKGCIACHTAAPGGDMVFNNDRYQ